MKYFGTDGFRGEANVGLTVEHAYKIGRFVGWYYGANRGTKARVIVGKDTRRSSYMFEAALVSGLVASGADAYMLHVIPTPGVAHQIVEGCFDCGIMISASHNPFCDNGIKLVNSDGYKMDEDVLEAHRGLHRWQERSAAGHGQPHRCHGGLHAGSQPLYCLAHCKCELFAAGRQDRSRLCQRLGILGCASRCSTRWVPTYA